MKSASGLVAFAQTALAAGTGYVYGAFGQECTVSLLDQKARQYPDDDLAGGTMRRVGEKWLGRRVTDCIGLVKYYLWSDKYGDDPQYNAAQDHGADQHFREARESGPIGTLPEIPGLLLHMPGHVGVYVGSGYAIEAAGTAEGVICTRVAGRGWDHWYKSIFLDYSAVGMAPAGTAATLDTRGVYQLRHGDTYQLRVTCAAGQPTVAVGNDSVCNVALRSHEGSNYYYTLTGKGQPGDSTGIYVNRGKVSSLVVRITSACGCDTGADMTRRVGECYTIGLTSTAKPSVIAGAAATVAGVFPDGTGHWLVPVVAVRAGIAEISTQVPGETAVRRFAVKVAE